MSVSIRIFKDGRVINERIFPGKSIKPVIEFLQNLKVDYRTDLECGDAYEITKNNDIKLMCIDDTNVLGVENTANFISEYLLEYNEQTYEGLYDILNE